jgi:CubicO group peptidase (beta-lactamase class C family)
MRTLVSIGILLISLQVAGQNNKADFSEASEPAKEGISPRRLALIDQTVNDYIKTGKIPGATALIIRNGKIVYHKAFGYSDREKKTLLKKDDIFRIASQTKAITSLAAMMLYEEGKFLLDDPVSKFIPEFKDPRVLTSFHEKDSSYDSEPARTEITIRHLLTHTSGIDYPAIGSPPFRAIYAKAGIPSGIGNDQDVLALKMKLLGGLPLRHHPGEKWTYGLNTDLLGYLIELWSGMTLSDFFQKRIFEPLGMKDSYFYLPRDKHSRLVTLYRDRDNSLIKMESKAYDGANPLYPTLKGTYYSGGAGLSSTVLDYAKFLQLFLNKGEYNGVRLLSRKTVELILTDQLSAEGTPEFGLAFGLETSQNDHQSILTIGSFQWGGAFNTHYWADPSENLIGLLYTNIYEASSWDIGERFKILTYSAIID